MKTTMRWILGAVLMAAVAGCASTQAGEAQAPTTTSAPCAPTDCAPCDETKSKCSGPMVCDHHPEKAKSVCARNAAGACASSIVCE